VNDLQTLLLGVALGAIPSAELGSLLLAYLSKRLGVAPSELANFADPDEAPIDENR